MSRYLIKITPKSEKTDVKFIPNITGMYVKDAVAVLKNFGLKLNGNFSPDAIVNFQEPKSGNFVQSLNKVSIAVCDNKKVSPQVQKVPVVGLPSRKAIAMLHNSGYNVRLSGSGRVAEQVWTKDSTGKTVCILKCK